jgi:hypothetical protein
LVAKKPQHGAVCRLKAAIERDRAGEVGKLYPEFGPNFRQAAERRSLPFLFGRGIRGEYWGRLGDGDGSWLQ